VAAAAERVAGAVGGERPEEVRPAVEAAVAVVEGRAVAAVGAAEAVPAVFVVAATVVPAARAAAAVPFREAAREAAGGAAVAVASQVELEAVVALRSMRS
jgi:hypothetical protein